MKKQAIIVFLGVLILMPIVVLATELNSYRIDSGGETYYVHYGGFVPCGKDVWASDNPDGLNGSTVHIPCQFCHLFVMLSAIVSFLLTTFVPLLAVGMLILAGIKYYLALGNPGKVTKANQLLVGIFLGLFLIYGAWLIVGALFSVIGVAEWTGLRSGWYQISCPLKYIAFEPVEKSTLVWCGMDTGPQEIGGMSVLCIKGTMMMSQTVGNVAGRDNAHKVCADLPLPSGISGKWVLPTLRDWRFAWWAAQDYLHCDKNCSDWDDCCTHGRYYYWTSNTEKRFIGGQSDVAFATKGNNAGGTMTNHGWPGVYFNVRCVYLR